MSDNDLSLYDIRVESGDPPAHFESPWIVSYTQISKGFGL